MLRLASVRTVDSSMLAIVAGQSLWSGELGFRPWLYTLGPRQGMTPLGLTFSRHINIEFNPLSNKENGLETHTFKQQEDI